jgi:hypothetical protein
MKWLLIIFWIDGLFGGTHIREIHAYDTKVECERAAKLYREAFGEKYTPANTAHCIEQK